MSTEKQIATEILKKGGCHDVETQEEAEVLIRALESVLQELRFPSISAPEINVRKKAAIIRTFDFEINLINPIIVARSDPYIAFQEVCPSFPNKVFNCIRYRKITLQNGLAERIVEFEGNKAVFVQHEVDHIYGRIFHDRAVKMVVARENGSILENDFCPCGSKKRFFECCKMNM